MNMVEATPPDRVLALDGLRGLAITLVLMHNCNTVENATDLLGRLLSRIAGMGWVGVQLFFVLSGFLITQNLLLTRGFHGYFKAFYMRRLLRIFPLYYATLIFFFVLLPWLNLAPQGIIDDGPHQIWFWTFLSNWTQQRGMGGLSLPHFWTLAVEEQYYLIWPFVVYWCTPKKLLYVCAALTIASLLARILMVMDAQPPMLIYTSSLGRMDALTLGAGLASILHSPTTATALNRHKRSLFWSMLVLLGVGRLIPNAFGMTDPLGQTLGYSLLAVLFAMQIALVMVRDGLGEPAILTPMQRLLTFSPLVKLGQLSFAVYVFHAPLHAYVGLPAATLLGLPVHTSTGFGILYLLLISAASTLLAGVSHFLLEAPFLRFKRFFLATPLPAT